MRFPIRLTSFPSCSRCVGAFALAGALFLVSACTTVTPISDPLAPESVQVPVGVVGARRDGPSLYVEVSRDSAASMQALAAMATMGMKMGDAVSTSALDPRLLLAEVDRVFIPFFRSIEWGYADTARTPPATDYTLVLSVWVKLGNNQFQRNSLKLDAVLRDAAGRDLRHLSGHGESGVSFITPFRAFRDTVRTAVEGLAGGMDFSSLVSPEASSERREIAASSPAPSVIAPAVAHAVESPTQPSRLRVSPAIYSLDTKLTFNVLDSVSFDAANGQLVLIGHRDSRFKDRAIPYLQLLATLLETPQPKFSLQWTPDSSRRVDEFLTHQVTDAESNERVAKWSRMIDANGQVNRVGQLMLPALGIYPIADNRQPGSLGVTVAPAANGCVRITSVTPGSAAAKADLRVGDDIRFVLTDRKTFMPSEFLRQTRFAGAGASVRITYLRAGKAAWTDVVLDASPDTDPWRGVNRYDVISMLYRVNHDYPAAWVITGFEVLAEATEQQLDSAIPEAMSYFMRTLKIRQAYNQMMAAGGSGDTPYQATYDYGLTVAQHVDQALHFEGASLESYYVSTVARTHDPSAALQQVFGLELDHRMARKIGEMMDKPLFQPGGGFQIPPELVEEQYHIHPEMVPRYLSVPPHSQLARVMFESDYLCKKLTNRPDLKRTIPAYQTEIEYQVKHLDGSRGTRSARRVWISIAGVDGAQSADGRTLALRKARMKFNVSETDQNEVDLEHQPPSGYAELLTSLFDRFEEDYATLHELREAAKLSAAAGWLRAKDPALRLPEDGRTSWTGPASVAGLVYLYMTTNLQHESRIFTIAEGGVSLALGPSSFSNDTSVVYPDTAALSPWGKDAGSVALVRAPAGTERDASSAYTSGWLVPATLPGGAGEAVVVSTRVPDPAADTQIVVNDPFGSGVARSALGEAPAAASASAAMAVATPGASTPGTSNSGAAPAPTNGAHPTAASMAAAGSTPVVTTTSAAPAARSDGGPPASTAPRTAPAPSLPAGSSATPAGQTGVSGAFGSPVTHLDDSAAPPSPARGTDTNALHQLVSIAANAPSGASAESASFASTEGFDRAVAKQGSLESIAVPAVHPPSLAELPVIPDKLQNNAQVRTEMNRLKTAIDLLGKARGELIAARAAYADQKARNPNADMAPVMDLEGKVDGLTNMVVSEQKTVRNLIELPGIEIGEDPSTAQKADEPLTPPTTSTPAPSK